MHNVPEWMLWIIIGEYIVIAFQFYKALKLVTGKGKRAMVFLVGIFLLCSNAGYLTGIFDFPASLALLVHGALIAANAAFIHLRQAQIIAESLN